MRLKPTLIILSLLIGVLLLKLFVSAQLALAILIVLFVVGAVVILLRQKKGHIFARQIAEEHGLSFAPKGDVSIAQIIQPNATWNTVAVTDVMEGNLSGVSLRIYNLLVKGKGGWWQTTFELQFPTAFPTDIALVNKQYPQGVTRFKFGFDKKEVLLEGDFNTHFNLYVKEGGETAVREILTPDVMQQFITSATSTSFMDLRIKGDKLVVSGYGMFQKKEEYDAMFVFAQNLVSVFYKK